MKTTAILTLLLSVAFCYTKSEPTIQICESVPRQLDIDVELTTTQAWIKLIDSAKNHLDIAQYYWTLTQGASLNEAYGGSEGMSIYNKLIEASKRGVKIRIVQNLPDGTSNDTVVLAESGYAEVRTLDFSKFDNNDLKTGILHTKMMVADSGYVYIGSANADWRSLTQVKELGILVKDEKIAEDTELLFQQYWDVAENNILPDTFPSSYNALANIHEPFTKYFDNYGYSTFYTSSAPKPFCSQTRTDTTEALLDVINKAKTTINIEVMDYLPAPDYMNRDFYWDDIDRALRNASYRGVEVHFLAAKWNHTKSVSIQFLKSLNDLDNIQVKLFIVPDMVGYDSYPYTRVNHAKFVGTDDTAFISNNNWTADYFFSTAGLTSIIQNKKFAEKLNRIFKRDWYSKYATDINNIYLK